MFTGIIEKAAPIVAIQKRAQTARIHLDLQELIEGTRLGDSIALDGVCLTVAALKGSVAEFDAVEETLSRTTLGERKPGDLVNVERSLRIGDRLGGHFVQGHVDGTAVINLKQSQGLQWVFRFTAAPELTRFMAPKGSVAVDGISLTLIEVEPTAFSVAVIPHTFNVTTLGRKSVGARVNIECDIICRYVARILQGSKAKGNITAEFLAEHGFR